MFHELRPDVLPGRRHRPAEGGGAPLSRRRAHAARASCARSASAGRPIAASRRGTCGARSIRFRWSTEIAVRQWRLALARRQIGCRGRPYSGVNCPRRVPALDAIGPVERRFTNAVPSFAALTVYPPAQRTLDILELLSDAPDGLALSAIAARLTLPKSVAHRLLAGLGERGFVEQNAATPALRADAEARGARLAPPRRRRASRRSASRCSTGSPRDTRRTRAARGRRRRTHDVGGEGAGRAVGSALRRGHGTRRGAARDGRRQGLARVARPRRTALAIVARRAGFARPRRRGPRVGADARRAAPRSCATRASAATARRSRKASPAWPRSRRRVRASTARGRAGRRAPSASPARWRAWTRRAAPRCAREALAAARRADRRSGPCASGTSARAAPHLPHPPGDRRCPLKRRPATPARASSRNR